MPGLSVSPRCILVTRLRFLGDIVLCTPLLEVLRERFPGASIEFLGCPPHVDVLEHHPAVDVLHRLPTGAGPGATLRMIRRLRSRRPEVAIDLFGNPRSALLVAASGAGTRIGSQRGLRSRLYTHRRGRPPGDRSAIRHHLDKAVPLLGELPDPRPPRIFVDDRETHALRAGLGLEGGRGIAVVHPGSTWPDKAWPEERWSQVIRWLVETRGEEVVVIEPPERPGLAAAVAEGTGARPLPRLSVRQVLALLTHARLYAGNDGGVLHAAVALRVPSLGLFGPTEPDIWFPYESDGPYRVLHRCDPPAVDENGAVASRLRSLGVEEVLEGLGTVLEAAAARREERADA